MKILKYLFVFIFFNCMLNSVYPKSQNTGYQQRVQDVLSWAESATGDDFLVAGAKLAKGDMDAGLKMFRRQMKRGDNSYRGMFIMYEMMTAFLAAKDKIPQSLEDEVRDYMAIANFNRGDTENHYTMYYTGLYLAAQTFPELKGNKWYTGKSSSENMREAEAWLNDWMKLTTTIGQGEFDSPTYMTVFIAPMFSLYQFALDPVMKQNAYIMLHWLIADYAVEHLNGVYVGAHSREYPERIIQPKHKDSHMTAWGWLFFGQTKPFMLSTLLTAAFSDFDLSEILYNIGTDRSQPYVHKETKRVRHMIRFSEKRNPPVYKYTYMTKDYGLGSMMGGAILQPIQQHVWDVSYMTDSPYMCIFTVHPYIGERDLGMFFPEEMKFAIDEVARHHTYYGSEDKWASSSPYEKTFQHKNTIIVLYNIPDGERFNHIDGFFPKDLASREVDSTGWIFCEAGNTYVAYFPLKPYKWIEESDCFRLRSYDLKNGCVVEVAQKHEYLSFNAFKEQIKQNSLVYDTFDKLLTVSYTNSAQDVMTFIYDGARYLNGNIIDYADYKLFKGPFLNAEIESRKLEIMYKKKGIVLDMDTGKKGNILPVYCCSKIDKDFSIDGDLDKPVWEKAETIQMVDAINGEPGRFKTEVKVLYSDQYLYVGFDCADDYIWGTVTESNGPIYDEECIEVFLNPAHTKHQYYELNLSPKNVKYQACVLNSRTVEKPNGELKVFPGIELKSYKTAVKVNGSVDLPGKATSWTAEYAIPFAEIYGAENIPPKAGDVWRVNFYRIDSPKKGQREHYAWSKTERPAFHLPWLFGYLKFDN